MNAIKYVFDLSCKSPDSFNSEKATIVNDFQLKKENSRVDNLYSHRILFNEDVIKCAKEFFHFDNYELLKRMTDEKVLKTLMFLYDNEAENQCAIKIEKLPLLERFKFSRSMKSEVSHGFLCLLILKNLQNKDKNNINEKIQSLIKGKTVSFSNGIDFSLMINYNVVPVRNVNDVVAEFRKIQNGFYKTIPTNFRFDWIYLYTNEPILLKFNGDSVLKLYFLANLLLFRYYKKTTGYSDCRNSIETQQLIERICSFTKEFPEQGPFHKMQPQFEEFMMLLISILNTIEAYAAHNSTLYQLWRKYNFDECAKMLDNLARKNVIPQSDDYVQKSFKNINGDMQNILFLKYSLPNKWSKIMVITGKQWIPIFSPFHGENKMTDKSLKNNNTIKNFVWMYSEMKNGTEPFIILDGVEYSIGIVEREKTINCIHKSDTQKTQWICLNCNEIGVQKTKYFYCNSSNKRNEELSFSCLSCWSQKLPNPNYKMTNLRRTGDNQDAKINDSSITSINSQSKISKPEIENELIQQKPGPSSLIVPSSSANQNNTIMNNKTITIMLGENLSKKVVLDENRYKLLEEQFKNANKEPISFLDEVIEKTENNKLRNEKAKLEQKNKTLGNERDKLEKHKAELEEMIRVLEEQVKKLKRADQQLPGNQQVMNNKHKDEIIEKAAKPKAPMRNSTITAGNSCSASKNDEDGNTEQLRPNPSPVKRQFDRNENEKKKENNIQEPAFTKIPKMEDKTEIPPEKKIYTIVVVGATGVGKSTLIGCIANYLKFPKFDDAAKNLDKIETCIPIQFTILRKDNSREIFQSGFKNDEPNKNENFNNDGHSVTQEPQIYKFLFNENTIRIIDTPGLEDTCGNGQDKQNMELIQKVIENQEKIHGICIVVNQSKLTHEFEMTIQKLLSLIPKSALNNVFFFFTFSSPTYFAIGDVLNPLKQLKTKFQKIHDATFSLESNRTYCVDSESFKYLLCKQQGIVYSSRPESDFMFPWEESSKSVIEFCNYLKTVKPVSKKYFTAKTNLLKLLQALGQKTISDEKQMAFEENFEKLKNMVAKHTLAINDSEISTNLKNVSQQEFYDAINNLIKLFPNRRNIFLTFKKYLDYLINVESNRTFENFQDF